MQKPLVLESKENTIINKYAAVVFSHYVVSDSFATPMALVREAPSVHGISPARILEWVAISFCRGFSRPRD